MIVTLRHTLGVAALVAGGGGGLGLLGYACWRNRAGGGRRP